MDLIRRRRQLWHHDKSCYWCGEDTRLLENHQGGLPPDAATVDHVRNRLIKQLNNSDYNENGSITVLACYRCNNLRGKYETWFINELDPSTKVTQPSPDAKLFHTLHYRLVDAVIVFLEKGGILKNNETLASKIHNYCTEIKRLRKRNKKPENEVNHSKETSS
jgi:hypothetical protein